MCNPERKSTGCARGAKGCRYIHPEDPDWSRAPTNDIFIRKLNLRHPNDSEKMSSWGPRRRDSIHNTSSNRPPTPPALKLARAEVDQEHTRPPATSPQQQQTTPSTIKADVPKDPRKQRDKPPLTPTEPPQQQRRFSSSINPEKGSSISENKPLEEYQTIQPASMDIDDPGASQYITNVKVAPHFNRREVKGRVCIFFRTSHIHSDSRRSRDEDKICRWSRYGRVFVLSDDLTRFRMISDYVAKNKDLQTAEAMRASAQRLFKLREDQSNKDDLATADQEIKGLKIGADSLLKKIADSATAILQESISREVIGSSASWLGSEHLARIQKELAEDRTFTTDHVNKVQVVLRDHVDAMELLELRIKEQEDRTRLRETPLAERSKELEKAVDANRGQIQSIQSTLDKQKDFDELLQESESRVVRQLQAQIEDFNAQCEGIEQDMLNKAGISG